MNREPTIEPALRAQNAVLRARLAAAEAALSAMERSQTDSPPRGRVNADDEASAILRESDQRRDESLRLERELLGMALKAGQMGVYNWNIVDNTIWWSPEIYLVFGVPESFTPTRESFTALVHPDDRQALWQHIEDAVAKREPFAYEFRILRPDGTLGWIGNRAQTEYDADGRPLRHYGLAVDITERKRIEQSFRASEAAVRARRDELETLMDAMPAFIFIAQDAACERMTCSRATQEMLRLARGANPSQSAPADERPDFQVWSDGRRLAPEELPMQRAAATGQAVYDVELDMVFPDGGKREIFGNALPLFNETGDVRGCVGVFLDIGARKQAEAAMHRSEERLRRAQHAARIGTWDWNLQTGESSWTEEAWTIFGRKPGDFTVTFENWLACVHPDDRKEAIAAIDASRRTGKYHAEYRVRDLDGTERWIEARGEFVFDAAGQPTRMLGTALDITERKHSERQLADAQKQLQQHAETLEATVNERTARLREIVTELEALSFSIAHDMRAPLRAMQGYATVLMSDHAAQLDGIGRAYLERIAAAARRMDGFIVDILNYSKIVRGALEITAVDAEKLILDIIASYPAFNCGRADITVETPLPRVLANEAALTQVVSNLLDNAVKFVAPGVRPRVVVRAGKNEGAVRLWFEDNGIGIPPGAQSRLFEIFMRLNRPDAYEGRGIGLAIVRKSVERMNGRVGVESEPGSGSRFWIQLNAAEAL